MYVLICIELSLIVISRTQMSINLMQDATKLVYSLVFILRCRSIPPVLITVPFGIELG